MMNFAITECLAVINIMTVITGTMTMPLITALQYSALVGLSGVRMAVKERPPG